MARPTKAEREHWDRRIGSRETEPRRERGVMSLDELLGAAERGEAHEPGDPTTPASQPPPGRHVMVTQPTKVPRMLVDVLGSPQVLDGTITRGEHRRREQATSQGAGSGREQGVYRKTLESRSASTAVRYGRNPAWITPAPIGDDEDGELDAVAVAFDPAEVERDVARARAERDAALAADERRCSHCDGLGIRAKGLCAACYEHRRTHGELPPIDGDALRKRRWRDEAPVLRKRGGNTW